jgi:hypothetical protein
MKWPAVYLQIAKDEELMAIREVDWTHDVDTHWAIGPIPKNEKDHFLVDSAGDVYSLALEGSSTAPPAFSISRNQEAKAVDVLRERASRWSGVEATEIADIIAALIRRDSE